MIVDYLTEYFKKNHPLKTFEAFILLPEILYIKRSNRSIFYLQN